MAYRGDPVRVLVIPGLNDSGPGHWQTWLQHQFRGSVRVEQDDWTVPDLDRWAGRIASTLQGHPAGAWVAVAHSFGCLALARYLMLAQAAGEREAPVRAALLVAPADPAKFGVEAQLPQHRLALPHGLVASETDPWMDIESARAWARRWGSQFLNLGDVGHINVDSGFGPLPQAKTLTRLLVQQVERARRPERAHTLEFSFAV
ncbi:alpha/beta hydrolase [Aquabacterium sp. A7-Y]|uniref:RBBP9/YdeN family alpha/beta hydrolase n=1 Tax=Aquabacterium sp. A7-Y TaxID=1349605 RepID=UPI00223D1753|nr:alpha/beta hydrolase [Aquabacterium sp. A7-Y]MCW7537122.1 alpha/beta hydrolase [Aquabacterium sp. A7-Y]